MSRAAHTSPLVRPFVGRPSCARGARSGITRSRLARTALAASLLLAVATEASASELVQAGGQAEVKAGTAHQRPRHPKLGFLDAFIPAPVAIRLRPPAEAPRFEWDAVLAQRLRHARDIVRDGAALGAARRVDRLIRGRPPSVLRFYSGQPQAGVPSL